jgi:hypothetical protein
MKLKHKQMKETMIKMFEEMLEAIAEQLNENSLSQDEIDLLLDSYIEAKKVLEKLKDG